MDIQIPTQALSWWLGKNSPLAKGATMSHLPRTFLALLLSSGDAGDGSVDPLFIASIVIIVVVLLAMYVYFRRKRKN